jgi:hypothetical protein
MKLRTALILSLLLAGAHAQEKPVKKALPVSPAAKATPKPGPLTVPVDPPPMPPAPPAKILFDLSADDAPVQFATRFFGLLQKGDVEGAYDGLTKGSKIAERPEELRSLKAKTREAIQVFGPIQGFVPGEVKAVGDRIVRHTYISLGREFPLRWRLYFYKPDLTWRLVDLRVDDRLSGIFDETEEPPRASDSKL